MPTSPSALSRRSPSPLSPRALSGSGVLTAILLVLSLNGCGNGYIYTGDHTDKDNYALKITPAAPVVTVGHSVHLTATSKWGTDASWSVLPVSIGAMDNAGNFTAAATPGQGKIVAMWKNDVRYTADAAVSVVAAPVATITTVPTITISTTAAAAVPAQSGSTFLWTIAGGSISSGQGTPSIQFTATSLGSVQLTCVVTNAAGDSATGKQAVPVIDLPPVVQYIPSVNNITRGSPIAPIVPVSTGGAPVAWTISPGLLPGLVFDPATGRITGTSTTLSAAVTYTVTATNSGGYATTHVTLASIDVPPAIAYVPSAYTFTRGSAISAIVPSTTGGAIISWSIAPALPAGLSFNSSTGVLTGTPTTLSSSATYTVTASNTGGSANASLSLRVVDAPPIIHYNPVTQIFTRGSDIGSIVPTNSGGPATGWSISPALPAGLAFDPATGILSGVPATPTPAAGYTVTATNTGGTSNAVVLTYTVLDRAPAISLLPSAYIFTRGTAITPVVPTLTSGEANAWTISPALPAGLALDPATGRISGTPTVLSTATPYTVTAANTYGSSATAAVTITVIDRPPVISYTPSAYSLTKGAVSPIMIPTNTGGPALTWAVTPSLPAGLTLDTATGRISGTPTTLTPSATYAVTATNTGGTSSPAILSIAIVDVVPSIGYSPSVFILTKGQTIAPIVPVNTGGSASSWSLGSPLPAGLVFDPATGRVSGTPTDLSTATSYTVSATNTGGSSTPLSLTLSVVDIVPVVTYPQPSYIFTQGAPINILLPANTGGTAVTWSISPSLPAGLSFDPGTGRITGTPIDLVPATSFSLTATNTGGTSQPFHVILNIVATVTAQIVASDPTPPFGASVHLTPTFAHAVTAQIGTSRGASDLSGAPVTGVDVITSAITSPHTFWLRATNAAGDSVDASVLVTPKAVAVGPITPGSPTRSVGTATNFSATATGGNTNTLTWTATSGSIDSVTGAWTAPSTAGDVTITATSKDDPSRLSSTTVHVVASGTAGLVPSTTTPLFGATVTLTPSFTGAVSATVGTAIGLGDLSTTPIAGTPIATAAITSAHTFWLRVTNAAGDTTDASATVTPQTVVVSPVAPSTPIRTVSTPATFTATATGGVTNTLTWTASAGVIDPNTGAWTAPSTTGTITITATSKDDPTRSSSTTVTVVAVGTSVLSANPTNPLYGATVALTPVFSNASSASIGTSRAGSDISTSPVTGVSIQTTAITSTKIFWLRTTNAAGDSIDTSVTVTPQTVVVGPIAPASPTRTVNTPTAFTATATGGSTNGLTWTASSGTMDAVTGAWTSPSTTGNVTITATSRDDTSKSASTIVAVVAAPTAVLTPSTTSPLYGATVNLVPSFANAVSATVGTSSGASDLSAAPTSGTALASPAITSTRTFWLRATNAAGDSANASATITPQTVALTPIAPSAPTRTVSTSTTFSSTATGGTTNGITWTATAGSMDPVTGVWTAPATTGNVVITATSRDDASRSVTTTVNVVGAATASITASTQSPAYGATVRVTPTFTGATSAKIGTTQGAGDLSTSPVTGTFLTTSPLLTPTTFWLRVTNAAGDFVDTSVLVTPQTVSVGAVTPASPVRTVSSSTPTVFSAIATGGTTNGITWSASAGVINPSTGSWLPPASVQTVVITATAVDDASKSSTTSVNVVATPTASLAASSTTPLFGATVTLTPTFANASSAGIGTARGLTDVTAAAVSGTGIPSSALTSATTFWLRATNAAGDSVDVSRVVTPLTVAISSITAGSTTVSVGYTTSLSAIVTNAQDTTIRWSGAGTFSPTTTPSASATVWTAPSVGTYTLTATSVADGTKKSTLSITVIALPVAGSLTVSNTSPLYGDTVVLTPTFSAGTGRIDGGIGSVTSGTAVTSAALTAPVTYTLTVTNLATQTATVSTSLITPQTVAVAVPVGANLKSTLTSGYTQAYTATVTGALNPAVTWSSTGGTFSTNTWTAPATPGTYTITATSVADPTKSNSTNVVVVAPPVITSFLATDPLISLNHSTTLTMAFTNGTGTARIGTTGADSSNLTATAVSGIASATGALTATTTFTLTVYNAAGNSTSASASVTVVAGSSTGIVSLTGPRYAHTSTLLPNGRVLIAGGHDDSAALSSSQLFDPSGPNFSDAGTMLSARSGHTATLLANNTVLLAGGNNGSTIAQSELWNGSFAATGALNTAREKHTATLLLNGKVLIVGGLNATSPIVTAELFDPATGTFSYTAGNLNTARYSHTATLLANGKVLIAGGYNGSVPLKTAELFDPSTGAFTVVASMSTARQRHAAVLLSDGTVAMIGGQGSSVPLASTEIFNVSTSAFTTTAGAMANARDGLAATLIAGGKVVVTGGINAVGNPIQGSEIFNPSAGTYALTALLATARTQHTATLLQSGSILLVGGRAQSGATATSELLDPQDGLTPVIPNAAVTAPVGANRAQTGLAASVPAQTHVQYVWMISGGTITAGSGTNAITFSMPATGTATLDVLVTSDRLVPSHVQWIVTPKPVISSFTAARPTVTVGTGTTLNWVVQDATGLSLDQGIGVVTGTSTPVTVATLGSTTYTLTATNAGGSVTATTSVAAVAAPVASSLTAAASTVAVGGNTSLTPTFSAGTGSIDGGIGTVLSGPAYPTPAISAVTTFTLTVTNAAGDIAQRSVTVGLQPVSVTGVSGPPYISAGHTATYTATVTGSVNTAVSWTSGAGVITAAGALTAPSIAPFNTTQTPLTITATSVNGGTPASLNIQVVPLPTITSFTSSPSSAPYGGTTTITPVFTNGSGQIVGIGSVTSGQAVTTGALTAAKTYTLIVTDLAGDTVSQNLTVNQSTVSVTTPTTTSGATVSTGDSVPFTASTVGSANTAVTWSASGGSFSGNRWTPVAAGTYTITASSVSPTGYSAQTTINVVDAPTITSFSASALTISVNGTSTLLGVFAGGTATVNPGAVTPISGTPFASAPLAATTTYTLTVTNSAGKSVSRTLIVNVVKGIFSSLTSNMAAGRVGHTVTLLTDGTVLVAGGNASTTAEIVNSSGQTLTPTSSPMQSVRLHHTATLLADGRVLLAGGSNGSSAQNTAELYDPSTGSFTASSATMSQARQNHTAALMPDGRVLLSGGLDASANALSSAEIYDPVSDTFTAATAMGVAREFAAATVLANGSTLITGGDDAGNSTSSAQVFNGATYTSATMSAARTQHTSTLLSTGAVLLVGGTNSSGALTSTEASSGGTFSPGANLSTARFGHTASLLASGDVLVAGGTADGSASLTDATIVDAGSAQIWATSSLSTARFQPASTILRNGKVLVTGGSGNPALPLSNALNTIELFDPQDGLTPTLPGVTLTAPTYAAGGTTGLIASVPAQSNVRYVWTLSNGTITAGLNTSSITFTKGSGGTSQLSVLVLSDRQIPVRSSASITTAPSITLFRATPSTNTVGLSTTLSWTATGATGMTLSINNGVGDVTASGGSTVIATPAVSTTYTLTATDANGVTTRNVTLTSVALPVATGLTAAVNPIEKGSGTTLVPTFNNGTATLDNSIGAVVSGVAFPTGTLTTSTTFTLTVANSVGTTVTRTLTVTVQPVVVAAISGPANVSVGSSSAQFLTSVAGAVDKTVTWSTSAGFITAAGLLTAPSTAQDILVTATSTADPAQHNQITVHVVALPLATGITAATNPVLYGGSTTITPVFSLGTAAINQGIGAVTSGVAYTTGTITAAKTFTLTVTSPSGDTATFPYTVNPQTVVVSAITGPASGNVTVSHTATFTATVTGAVNTSLTWTSTGGTWTSNTWTAPATPGTYVLTATAVNGATNTLSINVVAAPAIASFTTPIPGINKGQSSSLTATFTGAGSGANASGVVSPGALALPSGGSVSTGSLTVSQTYTLTVTNDAGDTATATATVQVFLGAFSATSNSIAPARNLPTATLRPDGNVLVAGGATASSAADLFDGTALSFTANPANLVTGRSGHTSTLLPNGLILIAGGYNGSSILTSAELYNPADGSFTATGTLRAARRNHRAILLDSGKVLLVGGTSLSSAEIYDPAAGSFSTTGSMAAARESATISRLADGRILVAGGLTGSTRLATAEIYDPSTSTFSTAATMLHARALHTATTLASGQILFAGGTGNTGTGSAELFNTSLMRFVTTGDMVRPRQEHIAALLPSGMVLIAGGNSGLSTSAIDQAELFDPSQGTFLKTDFMSTTGVPATAPAATILPSGQVLVTGGTSDGSAVVAGSELYTSTDGLTAPAADPTITTSATAGYIPQAATAVTAHVTAIANGRYLWMITGGTLVSGQGTPSITFNMPASGNATVDVLIVTDRQVPSHSRTVIIGEPAPTITSFTALLSPVVYGGSTSITPIFTNGLGGSVVGTGVAGSSDITASAVSGVALPTGPLTTPVQYRLTVTNRAGVQVNRTLLVSVQTVIVSAISPASPTVSVGDGRTFTATVTQALNTSIVWSATGGTIDPATGVWTAPATPGTYTIRATSAANSGVSAITAVTVVALPAIQSFTPSPASVNYGQAASLTPTFTGAAASLASIGTGGVGSSQISTSALTAIAVSTGPLTANTTYTLTVTNAAGATVSATAQVSVIQPFSATGFMALARLGQTTTALPDGTVLVAGGTPNADKAEIYTAGSAAFTRTQNMQVARRRHTATLLPSGKVLLAGGADATGALASAEIFDPSTGTFAATSGAMIHPRQNHVAALLPDGRVLIAGGSNATENQMGSAEIFDPATGAFTATATSLVSAREFATATTLNDGRVLVAGGFNGTTHLSTAEIFSTANAFAATALAMGSARSHHTATLLPSGKVLLAGGYDGTSRLLSTVLFVPGTPDTFSVAGTMSASRQDAAATLLAGGRVLVAGGTDGSTPRSSADLFNATSTSFTATGTMVAARSGQGSALLLDGTVLLDGGTTDGSSALASAERFDPQDSISPFQPDATVLPSTTHALPGTTGLSATAPSHTGNRYIWSLPNGTVTAGQGTSAVTFTMPATGDAQLDVLILSDHLVPAHGHVTVAADPLPQLASFTAALINVPYGGSTSLTAVFSNATGVTLGSTGAGSSNLSSSVTSGVAIPVGPLTASTSYSLTFPVIAGTHLSSSLTVTVLPVVLSPVTPAAGSVTASHAQAFTATVSQAANTAITWSATGGTMDPATGIWTAPVTPGTYTIRATAAADNTTSASTTVTVVALPSITSFTAASTSLHSGQTATLTGTFTAPTGSHATIGTTGTGTSDTAASVTSSTGVITSALTSTTTFTLTVTNAAGDSVTRNVTVTVSQPFSATGALALARTGQTTTALPDGSVLVAGGTGSADKAEIYTAGSGTFTNTTGSMQSIRRNHTATLLPSGKVLLTGGSDGSTALATAEIFDPATGSFIATAGAMIHARQNHAAALLHNGTVLLLGGSNPADHQLGSAEIFDPATGTFAAATSSMVEARELAAATALPNGDVLVTGGKGFSGNILGTAELYSGGIFGAQTFAMRSARSQHTATLLPGGHVLLAGGSDGLGAQSTAEIYTGGSTNASFTPVSAIMSAGRLQHTATLLASGKVLLSSGSDGTSLLATAEIFDPAAQTFATAGNPLAPRSGAGAALLQTGKVLIVGGTGTAATPLASAELFDPQDSITPDLSGITLSAPSTAATGSSQTASVTLPSGAVCIWSIEGGTIDSGLGSALIHFTSAATGNTILHVLVFNSTGLPVLLSQTVTGF